MGSRSAVKLSSRGLAIREADVSRLLNDWLEVRGWTCRRTPSGLLHTAKGRMRVGEKGMADWECTKPIRPGLVLHFYREDKARGGRLSLEQRLWADGMARRGYLVCCVPPSDDPLRWFIAWYNAHFVSGG